MFSNAINAQKVGHESGNNYTGHSFRYDMLNSTGNTKQDKIDYVLRWLQNNLTLTDAEVVQSIQIFSERDMIQRYASIEQKNVKVIEMHKSDIDKALDKLKELDPDLYSKLNSSQQKISPSDIDRAEVEKLLQDISRLEKKINIYNKEKNSDIQDNERETKNLIENNDNKMRTLLARASKKPYIYTTKPERELEEEKEVPKNKTLQKIDVSSTKTDEKKQLLVDLKQLEKKIATHGEEVVKDNSDYTAKYIHLESLKNVQSAIKDEPSDLNSQLLRESNTLESTTSKLQEQLKAFSTRSRSNSIGSDIGSKSPDSFFERLKNQPKNQNRR